LCCCAAARVTLAFTGFLLRKIPGADKGNSGRGRGETHDKRVAEE
jgi:hypothetical protein